MGRFRSQMISVRDLLRKMRSHAVISVLAAVGLATIGCGFVVFSAIGGLDTATYATKVIEEGDQVSIVYENREEKEEAWNAIRYVHMTLEEIRQQVKANHLAVERAEDAVVGAEERAQIGFSNTSEQIDGITAEMNSSIEAVLELGRKLEGGGSTDEKLNRLLEQMEISNQNIIALQTQLNEAKQEIEILKGMISDVGQTQNAINISISETESKRTSEYDALKTMIDTNAQNISNVSNRVPFPLGVDGEGEYGYIKAGADTVIPFRHPGPETGEAVGIAHSHAEGTACYLTSTVTAQHRCGGYMTGYTFTNCTKCGSGPDYCAANPACPKGGTHSVGGTRYVCTVCGFQNSSGGACNNTVSVPQTVSTLNCAHVTCGQVYIENGYHKTGRRECPLRVVCANEGAGMSIEACSWRAEENGIIGGEANGVTVTAAHNGLYICTVTLKDAVSGVITQQELSYRVVNLIK